MENANDPIIFSSDLPHEPQMATRVVAITMFNVIWPLVINIRKKLQSEKLEECNPKVKEVFTLCCSQIKKTTLSLFDVFKLEHRKGINLPESRQCLLERLSWCINKLKSIDYILDRMDGTSDSFQDSDDSLLTTPMYFVNWIDHAFEILTKLSDIIYRNDSTESAEQHATWKWDAVGCIKELHVCLDELLLSAMTLCKYCLPSYQHIFKARCQVVLRETKALLEELVTGDVNSVYKVTEQSLKLPIKPSNVNVLIDVLKDVLYVLETNTNTALLALLVHCFSVPVSPVDVVKEHFEKGCKGSCPCVTDSRDDSDNCLVVKEFDLYNERLLQIGSFAVSCSSDENRIVNLRSGLASLEALEPALVPALAQSPGSWHAELLRQGWQQEVRSIRDNVFLIVDPAPFTEKCKTIMHQHVLELTKCEVYTSARVCAVVDVAGVLRDMFAVYTACEPGALASRDALTPLLHQLDKVHVECKIVSNMLSAPEDFQYDVKKINEHRQATFPQLLKRLKLLYTIVTRINKLFHPADQEDFFENDNGEAPNSVKNITHTVARNDKTYVNSRKNIENMSRSIFARTANTRNASCNLPLPILTRHLQNEELSFSVQLDDLFNNSIQIKTIPNNKHLDFVRELSILYKYSPKDRSSLRKAVLSKNCWPEMTEPLKEEDSIVTGGLMDDSTSLQITEILDQMTNMTSTFSFKPNATHTFTTFGKNTNNVLTLKINQDKSLRRQIWNIPVKTAIECLDDTGAISNVSVAISNVSGAISNVSGAISNVSGANSNVSGAIANVSGANSNVSGAISNVSGVSSQPSNVTTLERLCDLDLLENKLCDLKLQQETSL